MLTSLLEHGDRDSTYEVDDFVLPEGSDDRYPRITARRVARDWFLDEEEWELYLRSLVRMTE